MKRYCLMLDLKEDPESIARYREHHAAVWPEVRQSLVDAGVLDMEIYLNGRRLFMIMEVADDFSFERKAVMDRGNARVQEWETLMKEFQAVPEAGDKEWRWTPMERVFSLEEQQGRA